MLEELEIQSDQKDSESEEADIKEVRDDGLHPEYDNILIDFNRLSPEERTLLAVPQIPAQSNQLGSGQIIDEKKSLGYLDPQLTWEKIRRIVKWNAIPGSIVIAWLVWDATQQIPNINANFAWMDKAWVARVFVTISLFNSINFAARPNGVAIVKTLKFLQAPFKGVQHWRKVWIPDVDTVVRRTFALVLGQGVPVVFLYWILNIPSKYHNGLAVAFNNWLKYVVAPFTYSMIFFSNFAFFAEIYDDIKYAWRFSRALIRRDQCSSDILQLYILRRDYACQSNKTIEVNLFDSSRKNLLSEVKEIAAGRDEKTRDHKEIKQNEAIKKTKIIASLSNLYQTVHGDRIMPFTRPLVISAGFLVPSLVLGTFGAISLKQIGEETYNYCQERPAIGWLTPSQVFIAWTALIGQTLVNAKTTFSMFYRLHDNWQTHGVDMFLSVGSGSCWQILKRIAAVVVFPVPTTLVFYVLTYHTDPELALAAALVNYLQSVFGNLQELLPPSEETQQVLKQLDELIEFWIEAGKKQKQPKPSDHDSSAFYTSTASSRTVQNRSCWGRVKRRCWLWWNGGDMTTPLQPPMSAGDANSRCPGCNLM